MFSSLIKIQIAILWITLFSKIFRPLYIKIKLIYKWAFQKTCINFLFVEIMKPLKLHSGIISSFLKKISYLPKYFFTAFIFSALALAFIFPSNVYADTDTWDHLVDTYKALEENSSISLDRDLTADASSLPLLHPQNNNITINGNNKTLNSDALKNLGFIFDGANPQTMYFLDIKFFNFISDSDAAVMRLESSNIFFNGNISFTSNAASSGGAIFLEQSTLNFFNSTIDFKDNFANGISNDIYLSDDKSFVFFTGNNVLPNGIRASGDAQAKIIKIGAGALIFGGDASIIQNTFIVESGVINFKSAVSTISVLEMQNSSTLSLENNFENSQLFISTLALNANLILDVNFTSAQSDTIYVSSVTIFTGNNLIVNNLNPYEIISHKLPIIVSNDFFRFNQQGKLKNNPENIFNYDSSLYDLYFDSAQKTLYIINIVPPDQEAAKTENQKAIEHIVNVDGYLKYPISKMSDEKKRFAYDSLSGVFLTNVFTSLLYQNDETLLSQISHAPLYEIWLNANYGGLEFSKLNQTLGAISAQMFDINIGGDLFSNSLLRAGIFAGISKKNFNQSNNRAVLTEKNVGIYSGIFLNRFNAMLLASAAQGEGESEREIKLDKTYNPQGEISLMQFNGALKLGYDFLINRAKNLRQNAGTFVLYEFNQVDIKQIKETDGGIVGLSFPAQTLQKHTAKFGFEFKQESSQMDFFINVFAGQDLEDKQKFELKFIGNEESFKIESDYENLIFYGGQFGINFHLTKAITLGTQFNIALNENLKNYNAGINMKYKFPKDLFKRHPNNVKTAAFRVPKLKFVKNSRALTKESELELDNFIKTLKQRAPHYKQVVILVKVDDARNEVSINTNKLTMSRANSVLKILTRNKVLRRKVILSSEKEGMRDAVELRIDFYRARKV